MDAYFDEDLIQHFAFHHVEGGKVAVRIGVQYGSEICRGTLHQIGLLLPIPEKLRDDLKRAERREAGFLMKDQKVVGSPTYADSWEVDLRDLSGKSEKE